MSIITVVALLLRLQRLRFGFAHQLVDYDDGVYFGSSLSLLDGRLPYRDFTFVQPPLLTLLLAPVALLAKAIGTAAALGVATVLTALAGAASVPLAARLVWHRGPVVVTLVASLLALQGDAVASASMLLLEPWVVLLCLLAATVIFDGDELRGDTRLIAGGVLLGLACATKIWAVVPLLAVVLVCLPRWRRAARVVGGAAAGFAVPVLPFLLASPGGFLHDVVVVQLVRTPKIPTPNTMRLLHLFGAAQPDGQLPHAARGWLVAAAVVIIAGGGLAIATTIGRARPLERFAVMSAVLVVAMLFVPGTFYWHYAAFAVPFLTLAVTLPLSRLGRRPSRVWAAVLALAVLGLAVAVGHRVVAAHGRADDHVALTAAVPAGSCVVATMPTATIVDDRFAAGRGCPQPVDPFGAALALTDGAQPSSDPPRSKRLAQLWLRSLRAADFVYVDHRETRVLPADASVRDYLRQKFRVVEQPGLSGTLYERVSSSPR